MNKLDAVQLSIFNGQLKSICEEMGFVLQRSAMSPNIKDRLDFSCAFFDTSGSIVAQAAHIPVHLGSMAYAMKGIVASTEWEKGDCLVLNDPYLGGTHLPDVTLISPLVLGNRLLGFVANRAHHANIGSSSPGSMPLSTSIEEEGVLIPPLKLLTRGRFVDDTVKLLNTIDGLDSDNHEDLSGDFLAQLSANRLGIERFLVWLDEVGEAFFKQGVEQTHSYGKELASKVVAKLPSGSYSAIEAMEDDGFGNEDVEIRVEVKISDGMIWVDFKGTSDQVAGNINCPESVAAASIYYVYMCLMPAYIPICQGAFDQIRIDVPKRSLISPDPGRAVAAGNVETSMRIVDVMLAALSQADSSLPAASQGTMNNVAMGSNDKQKSWDYYETLAGGMGASSTGPGLDGVQCHMTNTLNTPVESLEMHYPMRIVSYALRNNSGGKGDFAGGEGVIRQYEFLEPTNLTLLTERRRLAPRGMNGAGDGEVGKNLLNANILPGKVEVAAAAGDILTIETLGEVVGGGLKNHKVSPYRQLLESLCQTRFPCNVDAILNEISI